MYTLSFEIYKRDLNVQRMRHFGKRVDTTVRIFVLYPDNSPLKRACGDAIAEQLRVEPWESSRPQYRAKTCVLHVGSATLITRTRLQQCLIKWGAELLCFLNGRS